MLKIVEGILIVILLILGIETMIKLKNSAGKQIKKIRKPLLLRINIIMVLIVLISILTIVNIFTSKKGANVIEKPKFNEPSKFSDTDFNINLIKTANSSIEGNYLISPYSIEIALNMLKEGANNTTYDEINRLVNRKINDVSNEKVKVANAVFIKNKFKNYVEKTFYDNLKLKFNSEVLYDEFKTPQVINNWVEKNTDGMIKKILNNMSDDFVLGLANAIAIDVEWQSKFECIGTRSEEFTKSDGSKINVEMMHNTYKSQYFKYFDYDDIKGIVLPYENNLEFIGIIPNDINEYINNLTLDKLVDIDNNAIAASNKLHILLSLPRFSYSFDLKNFKEILITMGIKSVFNSVHSDLTNIITKENLKKVDSKADNIYVSDAIHKTYIELNEKGTKAAAVTYFGIKEASAAIFDDYKEVKIEFNKPFIYMIRDTENKEILFFGVVQTPNVWNGSTCSNID